MSFFFNDTATTEIYTLSLHDALPISSLLPVPKYAVLSNPARFCVNLPTTSNPSVFASWRSSRRRWGSRSSASSRRSEEHTSELQSRLHLVCRLLLEKKKNNQNSPSDK